MEQCCSPMCRKKYTHIENRLRTLLVGVGSLFIDDHESRAVQLRIIYDIDQIIADIRRGEGDDR